MKNSELKSKQLTEQRNKASGIAGGIPKKIKRVSLESVHELLNELHAHQAELETQNKELRKAQLELGEARNNYSELYDFAPIGYFTISEKGKIIEANLMATSLLGVERQNLIGKHFSYFIVKEDQDAFYILSKQLFETGLSQVCELKLVKKEGAEFYSRLECVPRKDALGNFTKFLVAVSDITKSKEAEQALQRSHSELEKCVKERTADLVKANEELKKEIEERKRLEKTLLEKEKREVLGAVAAVVAHEIRNPIVSIGGFAHRLKQRFSDLPECEIILKESRRLETLLSEIGRYLEHVEIHPRKCSVYNIIMNCLDLLSHEMKEGQMQYLLNLSPRLPSVYVDPEILNRVFTNLIRSAAGAMEKGGRLIIQTYENGQDIQIELKSKDIGLKTKQPGVLFMPFEEEGRNLGLPICHRLVKDMGGLLSFAQDKDYTIFTVSLPRAS